MIPELLALAARAVLRPEQQDRLRLAADSFSEWDALPAMAEQHGIAPLLYTHLAAAGIPVPATTMLALKGLALRHRSANAIRFAELQRILTALHAAQIPVLLLKGAALAHVVYPDPALRPMRDIDLLIHPDVAVEAQSTLASLGYKVPPAYPGKQLIDHHHLPPCVRVVDGLSVCIELHHRPLYAERPSPASAFDALYADARPVTVGTVGALTPPLEALLWQTYRHGLACPVLHEPFCLKDVADTYSLLDAYHDVLDWPGLRTRRPRLMAALRMLHHLAPLSPAVAPHVAPSSRPPHGVGVSFAGCPTLSWPAQRAAGKSVARILRDSLLPSDWWLGIYYGQSSRSARLYLRGIRHPAHMLYWTWRFIYESMAQHPYRTRHTTAKG
ncbi:MAG: nucleotidyltransferase family protein [Verrucomicrobia bacterium]|jgi:hypothetical protein|nr:nucleotidyltransferase family protein [Verrucomicrobiota bacterium]MBT7700832.1 nucleotidyltransferase family protein [Verrucomicrobiota bacterium]